MAQRLGKSVSEAKCSITATEFIRWKEKLFRDWNRVDKSDNYLASVAYEIASFKVWFLRFIAGKEGDKLEDPKFEEFILKFKIDGRTDNPYEIKSSVSTPKASPEDPRAGIPDLVRFEDCPRHPDGTIDEDKLSRNDYNDLIAARKKQAESKALFFSALKIDKDGNPIDNYGRPIKSNPSKEPKDKKDKKNRRKGK